MKPSLCSRWLPSKTRLPKIVRMKSPPSQRSDLLALARTLPNRPLIALRTSLQDSRTELEGLFRRLKVAANGEKT